MITWIFHPRKILHNDHHAYHGILQKLKPKWDVLLFYLLWIVLPLFILHSLFQCCNPLMLPKSWGPNKLSTKRIKVIKCVWWSVNKLFDVYWILFSHHMNGSSSWQHSDAWQYNKEQLDIIQYHVTSWLYSRTALVLLHNFKSWLCN